MWMRWKYPIVCDVYICIPYTNEISMDSGNQTSIWQSRRRVRLLKLVQCAVREWHGAHPRLLNTWSLTSTTPPCILWILWILSASSRPVRPVRPVCPVWCPSKAMLVPSSITSSEFSKCGSLESRYKDPPQKGTQPPPSVPHWSDVSLSSPVDTWPGPCGWEKWMGRPTASPHWSCPTGDVSDVVPKSQKYSSRCPSGTRCRPAKSSPTPKRRPGCRQWKLHTASDVRKCRSECASHWRCNHHISHLHRHKAQRSYCKGPSIESSCRPWHKERDQWPELLQWWWSNCPCR